MTLKRQKVFIIGPNICYLPLPSTIYPKPLTMITKRSILDVAAALDPPVHYHSNIASKH